MNDAIAMQSNERDSTLVIFNLQGDMHDGLDRCIGTKVKALCKDEGVMKRKKMKIDHV